MSERSRRSARVAGRDLLGHSYRLSRRYALLRLARRRESPIVVFSMGKTGSTAVARAVHEATAQRVFQVFRLDAARLREAEHRYRVRNRLAKSRTGDAGPVAFPGAHHLWESEYLVRHLPTPAAPWTVITTVREPVSQALSAFFHAARGAHALAPDSTVQTLSQEFRAQGWLREPLRWFEREFTNVLGIDVMATPFDTNAGHAVIETPAVRLLLLRQENLEDAATALGSFLGLLAPVPIPRRNEGAAREHATTYGEFLRGVHLAGEVLDEAYNSEYAQHFYEMGEIAEFRRRWSGPPPV